MKRRALLCAVFSAAILLGCATPSITQVAPGTLECPRAQCQLNVSIDGNGNLTADHSQVNLKVPNTIITWTLHNRPGFPTYEFRSGSPQESIVFKDPNAAAAPAEFTGRIAMGTLYRIRNTGTNHNMKFGYEVRVFPVGGGSPKILDPTIFNDF